MTESYTSGRLDIAAFRSATSAHAALGRGAEHAEKRDRECVAILKIALHGTSAKARSAAATWMYDICRVTVLDARERLVSLPLRASRARAAEERRAGERHANDDGAWMTPVLAG